MNANSRQYRSALALNNMAVRLLERHCYKQAAETLRESTLLIKAVLKRAALDGEINNDTVQMATKRYAQAKPSTKRSMVFQILTMSNGLLFENNGSRFANSVLDDVPSSCVAFPILIEDDSLLEKDSWDDSIRGDHNIVSLYIQAAIMFHNAAIASRSCHQHKRALRFSRIAAEIFHQEQVHCPIASLAVQNTLIRCLTDSGYTEEAAERYGELLEMRLIAHHEAYDHIPVIPAAAAAA